MERPGISFTRQFMVVRSARWVVLRLCVGLQASWLVALSQFAQKYGRLPTRTDFMCYVAHRGGGVTVPLPQMAVVWFERDRAAYARALGVPAMSIADGAVAFGGLSVMLGRFNASAPIAARVEMEADERSGHPPPRLLVLPGAKNAGFYFGEGVAPEPPTPTPDGAGACCASPRVSARVHTLTLTDCAGK